MINKNLLALPLTLYIKEIYLPY